VGLIDSPGHHLPLDVYCDDHDVPKILDQEEDIEGKAELGYGIGVQPGRLWAGIRDCLRREWKAVYASRGVASLLSSLIQENVYDRMCNTWGDF
jgi:hypothetical protein